jgi:hypothetical protein
LEQRTVFNASLEERGTVRSERGCAESQPQQCPPFNQPKPTRQVFWLAILLRLVCDPAALRQIGYALPLIQALANPDGFCLTPKVANRQAILERQPTI